MNIAQKKSRCALITGAASGLGASFAEQLAALGYDLVLIDRQADLLQSQAAHLKKKHPIRILTLGQDLTLPRAVDAIFGECSKQGFTVDFLVNNAGYHLNKFLRDYPWSDVENNLHILLQVVVEMTYKFLPGMIKRGWGRVINVASVSGFFPGGVRLATYNASKTFLIPFSEALNFELNGTGVQVTALCPGFMRTNLFRNSGITDVSDSVPSLLWLEPNQVAAAGLRAVMKHQSLCIPSWIHYGIVIIAKYTPRPILRERTRILHRASHKKASGQQRASAQEVQKTALITGASSGIGASFCRVLAAQGYQLILVARRVDQLNALAAKLTKTYGVATHVIVQDLTEKYAGEKIVQSLSAIGWSVDLLVNNAGYPVSKVFVTMTWPEVSAALQLYLYNFAQLIHLLVPSMIIRGHGQIINISSLAAFEPGSYQASLYSSAKAFQLAYSESLAAELEGTGVSVTVVCPGFTKTEWSQNHSLATSSLPKFLWMESKTVAEKGIEASLQSRLICITATGPMRLISTIFHLGPRHLIGAILSKKRRRMNLKP